MFDRFVVVDWSANSTPKLGRDSIWIADARRQPGRSRSSTSQPAAKPRRCLVDLFEADPRSTTLVGVDFSLGYPAGTAAALGLGGTPWSAMWAMLAEQIVDDDRNGNNRFTVAARAQPAARPARRHRSGDARRRRRAIT